MKYLVDNRNSIPIVFDDGREVVHAHLTKMDADGMAYPIQFDKAEAQAMSLEVNGTTEAITPVRGDVEDTDPVEPDMDDDGNLIYDQKDAA